MLRHKSDIPYLVTILLYILRKGFSDGFVSCTFTTPLTSRSTIKHHDRDLLSSSTRRRASTLSQDFNEQRKKDTDRSTIQVFDNVFSSYACEELTSLTQDHSERGNDGSSVFTRPPHNEKPLTPIEHAIDSFLISINDTTQKVEYWSRDEYINIDAHADIDEEQLEDEDILRCPQMGHVLYLEVEEGLRGPTCVFPSKPFGWDNKNELDVGVGDGDEKEVDLVVVPAVKGRVLRFPGNVMHSVPCPAHRYVLPKDEETQLRQEEEENCGEEKDEEDDYYLEDEFDEFDDNESIERSVLLFNTWPDDQPSPKGVNGDYITGSLPEGIELSEEDAQSYFKSEEALRLTEWEEDYGIDAEKIQCKSQSEWNCIEITTPNNKCDDDKEQLDLIRIGLMGNQNRRLWRNKFVNLFGSKEDVQLALTQSSTPTFIALLQPMNKQS